MSRAGEILAQRKQSPRDAIKLAFGYYSRPDQPSFGNIPPKGWRVGDKWPVQYVDQDLKVLEAFYPITQTPPLNRFLITEGVYRNDVIGGIDVRPYIAFEQRPSADAPWETYQVWNMEQFGIVIQKMIRPDVIESEMTGLIKDERSLYDTVHTGYAVNKKDVNIHVSPYPVRKALEVFYGMGLRDVDDSSQSIWRFFNRKATKRWTWAYSLVPVDGEWCVKIERAYARKYNEKTATRQGETPGWNTSSIVPLDKFMHGPYRRITMPITRLLAHWTTPLAVGELPNALEAMTFDHPAEITRRGAVVRTLQRSSPDLPLK